MNCCSYQKLLAVALVLFANYNANTQVSDVSVSIGLQYASARTQEIAFQDAIPIPYRRAWWASVSSNHKISKFFILNTGLTYQERKALETFQFPFQPLSGVQGRFIVYDYPTNPQNPKFNSTSYLYFPNFKYIDLELVPLIKFGDSFFVEMGVGIFGGILLNRREVEVTPADIPSMQWIFESPFNATGTNPYTRFDFGLLPKINIAYKINTSWTLACSFKNYHSLWRVNDSFTNSLFTEKNRDNFLWRSYMGGVEVRHTFKK